VSTHLTPRPHTPDLHTTDQPLESSALPQERHRAPPTSITSACRPIASAPRPNPKVTAAPLACSTSPALRPPVSADPAAALRLIRTHGAHTHTPCIDVRAAPLPHAHCNWKEAPTNIIVDAKALCDASDAERAAGRRHIRLRHHNLARRQRSSYMPPERKPPYPQTKHAQVHEHVTTLPAPPQAPPSPRRHPRRTRAQHRPPMPFLPCPSATSRPPSAAAQRMRGPAGCRAPTRGTRGK